MASYEDDLDTAATQQGSSVVPWVVAIIAVVLGALAAFHFSSQRDTYASMVKKAQDDAKDAKAKLANSEAAKANLEQQLAEAQSQKKAAETARSDLQARNEDLTRQLAQAASAAPPAKGGKKSSIKVTKGGKRHR